MIISHKLKIIYIKPYKAASASFEAALSRYCGENDVITPLNRNEDPYGEVTRQSLGFRSAQNYIGPKGLELDPHIKGSAIKSLIPPNIWNNYLKITAVRCSYDQLISEYFFMKFLSNHFRNCDFSSYVTRKCLLNQFMVCMDQIHINGKIIADFLIRFEHLNEDIEKLENEISCPGLLETFQGIRLHGEFRPEKRTSCELYSKYQREKSLIDLMFYKKTKKYEFIREYWPDYKARLDSSIRNNVSITERALDYSPLKLRWLYFFSQAIQYLRVILMYEKWPRKIRLYSSKKIEKYVFFIIKKYEQLYKIM